MATVLGNISPPYPGKTDRKAENRLGPSNCSNTRPTMALYLPARRQQMKLIPWKGGELALPQMPPPLLPEVDAAAVAPVRFADRRGQPFLRLRHGNQMDMIRHQAVGPDRHTVVANQLVRRPK